jgi:tRNA (guanine26-N2/guanine27-N2)-dimethyltransferase
MEIIRLVHDEIGFPPGFYNVDMLCSKLGMPSMASGEVLSALKEAGFKSTKSHIDMRGIKTDATVSNLEGILTSILKGKGGGGCVP